MAENVLDEVRRRGDKWALGMMLVLLGSVRLWTGRGSDAIPSLEEASALFTAIDAAFGGVQATATLGRAHVAQGRSCGGPDLLAGPEARSEERGVGTECG